MKQKTDSKAKPKTPLDAKKTADKKGKDNTKEENEEEKQPISEEPQKVIERFIHVTTYSDSESLKIIKELFEEINQKAFQLRSVKEIYTRNLSEEEQNSNEIDYISGCQIIDKDIRITILEGLTGKGMDIVKAKLPKKQMNTNSYKIFADSKCLFSKREYSKFDLSLKYIKLRDTLSHILTTFDIYSKANKYREIYDTFMNYGSILKCETLQEITDSKLFPEANSLLLLERKYADILSDEDMTGIPKKKKKKKRFTVAELMEKMPVKSDSNTYYSGSDKSMRERSSSALRETTSVHSSSSGLAKEISKEVSKAGNEQQSQNQSQNLESVKKRKFKPDVDSKNEAYDMNLLNRHRETLEETKRRNLSYLSTMKRKINKDGHFCRVDLNSESKEDDMYIYSQSRKNVYTNFVEKKRLEYIQDKDHFYSYSKYGLNLSFPLIPNANLKYQEYMENKSKWVGKDGKDFDIYKQPKKEMWFFPMIDNKL